MPVLGLAGATAGEVILAVRGRFADNESTVDPMHLHAAIAEPAAAVAEWRLALEAGDMRAHYGLGYTLVELGRPREAYGHLRVYTELTPHNAWAWSWLGRAAQAMGDVPEAAGAYRRAIALKAGGAEETDAPELLEALCG